jgi:hypothetical protein
MRINLFHNLAAQSAIKELAFATDRIQKLAYGVQHGI